MPPTPKLLILNQMAGPMTWELAEDAGRILGHVAVLTGHPDTLAKGSTGQVRLYPAATYRRGSFFRRALSWLHYSWQAFFWLWRWPADIPVLLFSNPPILIWVGYLLRILRGQRYSVMVHDIYPDILVRLAGYSEGHLLIRLWRWLNRKAYENAESVMTLGELMAENLEKQFDSSRTHAGQVDVVYPWVDTDKIKPIPKEENWFARKYGQVGKLTVMYSGNMGLGHDIETMLEAARLLEGNPDIHFMFIGAGPKWNLVKETIESEGLTNATLLPWQPEENLPYQLATADIGLVSLEPELWDSALPSKAIAIISSGAMLLGLSKPGSTLEQLIRRCACGVNHEKQDLAMIVEFFRSILDDATLAQTYRESARKTCNTLFARKNNSHQIIQRCIT